MKKIPIRIQMTNAENGATALFMMLGYYGKFVEIAELREVCLSSRNGTSPKQMIDAGTVYGLKGTLKEVKAAELKDEQLPVMLLWKKRYYVILRKISGDMAWLVDPAKGEYKLPLSGLEKNYGGKLIYFARGEDFVPGGHQESMFELIQDRIRPIIRPIIRMVILSVIAIVLDMWLSEGMKFFMDEIIAGGSALDGLAEILKASASKYEARSLMARIMMFLLYFLTIMQMEVLIAKNQVVRSTSRRMSALSNSKMIKKILSQPLRFFESYSTSELMSRIDSNEKLEESIMDQLVPRMINTFMTFFYFFYLFSYDHILTLICISIEVINIIVILKLQERNVIVSRTTATTSNNLNSSVLNGMNMIETIRSTGSEQAFFNMWYDSLQQVNDSRLMTLKINRIMSVVESIHSMLIQAVRLFLGAYFISLGRLTLGTLSLFANIFSNLRSSLNSALSSINAMQQMRTNIERVNDIMDRPEKAEIPLAEGVEYEKLSGAIKVDNVTYRYNKADEPAIADVSLEVKPGQMVALVGSTGCGKSTLLKVMADLYTAESGSVLYDGKRREEIPDVVFHSSIMSVDQEATVFEDSVFSNIQMWDDTIENFEGYLAARDAQIHERIMADRKGYNAQILENGQNFSGGEIQRLELARALAHEPTLLFLDEFTSALDALTEDRVIRNIRDKGTTCVIVAHRLSTIVDCDCIYVMDKGRIVEQGTHEELYKKNGLYKTLVSSQ